MRQLAKNIIKKRKIKATPDKYPQGKFKDKDCRFCGKIFKPLAPSHLYCSDKCAANGISHNYYFKTYGLTLNEVETLLEKQNYVCMLCEEVGFKMNDRVYNTLNVDHCHKTGVVRGLLCHNCNRGLGLFKDSPELLRKAAHYLESATTIPKGSTYKCMEAHDIQKDDDIV